MRISEHCEFIHMRLRTQIELGAYRSGADSACTLCTDNRIDAPFFGRLRSDPCVSFAFIAMRITATTFGPGSLRVSG